MQLGKMRQTNVGMADSAGLIIAEDTVHKAAALALASASILKWAAGPIAREQQMLQATCRLRW
jgi:hypothetical protein